MNIKIDIKIVVLIIIALFAIENIFFKNNDPEKIFITTSPKFGEEEKVIDSFKVDTVYIKEYIKGDSIPSKKEIIVDSLYKSQYEKALKENDSLKAKNLFLESIAIDTWDGTLIENNDIKIDGKFITRGKLLEYNVKYKIKKDTLTYVPETITKFPNFSLTGGIKVGMPINPNNNIDPIVQIHLGLRNKKGNTISFGFDTQKRINVGYEMTLFKTKR